MEITKVRMRLVNLRSRNGQTLGFCAATFDDCFRVNDFKVIIRGTKGLSIAVPDRKLVDQCPGCHTNNCLQANYCNQCGCKLAENRAGRDSKGRLNLHTDVAFPINTVFRNKIQDAILGAYEKEVERSKEPGYVPSYDDYRS